MKSLAKESFTPSDQKEKDKPATYDIKSLSSLELTEVMADGSDKLRMGKGLSFGDIKRLLSLGLAENSQDNIESMPSAHHAEVANAILTKALVSEQERKKLIIAVEVSRNAKKFDCDSCTWGRHCDKSNPAPFPKWEIPEINLKSKTCLLPMITEESSSALSLYSFYKDRVLAISGGVLEQPHKYIESMKIIERQVNNV